MVKQPYIMPLSGGGSSKGSFVPVGSAWSWAEVSEVIAKGNVPLYVYVDNGHERLLSLADIMEGDAYKFSGVYAGAEYMVTLSQNGGWSSVSILNLADVFPVEYGVTSFHDITGAIEHHALPVLNVTENADIVSVYNLHTISFSHGEIYMVWFRRGNREIGVFLDGQSETSYSPLPGEVIHENIFYIENNGDHTGTPIEDILNALDEDKFVLYFDGDRIFYPTNVQTTEPYHATFASFDGKYFDIAGDESTGSTYYSYIQEKVSPITFLNGSETVSEIADIIMSGSIPVYLDISSGRCYYGTEADMTAGAITLRSGNYILVIDVDPGTGDTRWGSPYVDSSVYVKIDQGNINADKTFYIDGNGFVDTTAWPLYQIIYGTTSIVNIVMAISDNRLPIMLYGGEAYIATAIDLSTYTLILSCAGKKIIVTPDGSGGTNYSLPEDALVAVDQGVANAGKMLVVDALGKVTLESLEVFPVTYGTTTFTEIANAVAAQKLPVMVYQYDCYVICSIDAMMGAEFVCAKAGSIQQCSCSTGNVWSHSSFLPVNSNQGIANAGKFLVVGNDGIVAPVTMAQWTGGSY